jgi:hypothetical protein
MAFAQTILYRLRPTTDVFRGDRNALRESALSWHLKISCEINMIISVGNFPGVIAGQPRAGRHARKIRRGVGHPENGGASRACFLLWLEQE